MQRVARVHQRQLSYAYLFFDGDGLDYKLTSLYIRQIYVLLRYSLTGTKVL